MKNLVPCLKSSVENSSNLVQKGGCKIWSTQNATKRQHINVTSKPDAKSRLGSHWTSKGWMGWMSWMHCPIVGLMEIDGATLSESWPCLLFGTRKDADYTKVERLAGCAHWSHESFHHVCCLILSLGLMSNYNLCDLFILVASIFVFNYLQLRSLMTMINLSCSQRIPNSCCS